MAKVHREAVALCRKAGLQIVEVVHGKRHLKIVCRQGMVICASSPSDHRWQRNLLAIARRIANDR